MSRKRVADKRQVDSEGARDAAVLRRVDKVHRSEQVSNFFSYRRKLQVVGMDLVGLERSAKGLFLLHLMKRGRRRRIELSELIRGRTPPAAKGKAASVAGGKHTQGISHTVLRALHNDWRAGLLPTRLRITRRGRGLETEIMKDNLEIAHLSELKVHLWDCWRESEQLGSVWREFDRVQKRHRGSAHGEDVFDLRTSADREELANWIKTNFGERPPSQHAAEIPKGARTSGGMREVELQKAGGVCAVRYSKAKPETRKMIEICRTYLKTHSIKGKPGYTAAKLANYIASKNAQQKVN